ncbi:hypothetical protein [Burkholderia vietnamiensis]|uniref:hypothetical protein n=1 Tax=Burkholderia vietnamiensis TaxID=60552 RepID=UPI000AF798E8|nr:hypothetical protein [Burkholderia vietnamiensis]MBR8205228.1 hypothetical protein [Burkholderia vietnamiensis]HDR9132025.1 hypothetical protein [Burkholderia vietnamiensis]
MLKILNRIKIAKPAGVQTDDAASSAVAMPQEPPAVQRPAPTWHELSKRLATRLEHAEGLSQQPTMPNHQPSQRRPTR